MVEPIILLILELYLRVGIFGRQQDKATDMDERTPIFMDLQDNHNQNTRNRTWPVDEVSGYTLRQMQAAINNSRHYSTIRDKLNRNRPAGVTQMELFDLFDEYIEIALQNPKACK